MVFCSEAVAEVVHPPKPLTRRVYSCGRHFDTSFLKQVIDLERGPVYGAIAIDGSEASLGMVRGLGASPDVSKVVHLTSTTASRTRRGGQSALRYSRLRDEAELAFLRKVAEHAHASFGDVQGLVLAGKADMKHKLLAELPDNLRKAVLCVVDLAGNADMQGLRQAAHAASPAAVSNEQDKVDAVVNHFFELAAKSREDTSLCCYGAAQTAAALKLGAVKDLLIAPTLTLNEPEKEPGHGSVAEDWKALAAQHGAQVLEVRPRSQQSTLFCDSFGIGGCLRWPVDPCMLEDEDEALSQEEETEAGTAPPAAAGGEPCPQHAPEAVVPCTSASEPRGPGESDGVRSPGEGVLLWVREKLLAALGDPSATEALLAGVEVILGDESTSPQEAAASAAEILTGEGVPEAVGRELEQRWLRRASFPAASEQ